MISAQYRIKGLLRAFLPLLLLIACGAACNEAGNNKPASTVDDEVAIIDTDYGRIVIELFPGKAPKHVENFKKLIKEGFYDGTAFHRVIPNRIIQGGDPNSKTPAVETWGMGQPNQPKIQAEFSDLKHLRATVSAARASDINSATSQFFICSAPNPSWDNQYSVFGQVIEGMNVVDIISNSPTVEGTERPIDKIAMKKVTLDKRANFPATAPAK